MKQLIHKETGLRVVGVIERVLGIAGIAGIHDDGELEYTGETEMNWDTQVPLEHQHGERAYQLEDGRFVPSSECEARE